MEYYKVYFVVYFYVFESD